jgi:hypothetical protein
MFEAQLGWIFVWPILLRIIYRNNINQSRLVGTIVYYASFGFFIFWRFFITPQFMIVDDGKLGYLDISVSEIIGRYFLGMRIILGGFKFPYIDNSWITLNNIIILSFIIILYIITYKISNHLSFHEKSEKLIQENLLSFSIGLTLWISGYFPIILNFPPNIWSILSRVNIFTALGAGMMIISLIDMVVINMSIPKEFGVKITGLIAFVLIFMGSIVQLQVQESLNKSWEETKIFYVALFNAVPNVKDNTEFVFLLAGYKTDETIHRPLFSTKWEPSYAMSALYNNPNITVMYRYNAIDIPAFPESISLSGIFNRAYLYPVESPENLIVIKYDRSINELEILYEIDNLSLVENNLNLYLPNERILQSEDMSTIRSIVE